MDSRERLSSGIFSTTNVLVSRRRLGRVPCNLMSRSQSEFGCIASGVFMPPFSEVKAVLFAVPQAGRFSKVILEFLLKDDDSGRFGAS